VLLAGVRQLSPVGQQVVRVAAVAGRRVRHDWLAVVAGGPDDELDSGLTEAVARGLLMVTAMERAGPGAYEFRHALLQEAVYGELLPGKRARLHRAYADAIANAPAARQAASRYAAELAEHWYQAGQPGEALAWSARAADGAERVYAHAEVARHCDRAATLWDQVPDAADRVGADRAELHRRAARAWEYAGDETRARTHVEEALRHVDPAADPVRAGLLHNLRSWYAAGTTDLDVVLAASREAVRLVAAEPPSTARAQVLLGYGRTLHLQAAQYDEAAAAYAHWRHAEALLAGGAGAARAAGPLRDAHATTARLGAASLRTEIEALARRARISLTSAGPSPSTAPAHPHGLTDREAAVLRLLAAGQTNRQIGQQLFISPKTASVHVTSILRKLAVPDRVQAAAVAVRLGLVNPPVASG
jgi:DNA-binding NarL/FixJ family response regulator